MKAYTICMLFHSLNTWRNCCICEGKKQVLLLLLQNDQRMICPVESGHCVSPCPPASGKRNRLSQQTPGCQWWQTLCTWSFCSDEKTLCSHSCGFLNLYETHFLLCLLNWGVVINLTCDDNSVIFIKEWWHQQCIIPSYSCFWALFCV